MQTLGVTVLKCEGTPSVSREEVTPAGTVDVLLFSTWLLKTKLYGWRLEQVTETYSPTHFTDIYEKLEVGKNSS